MGLRACVRESTHPPTYPPTHRVCVYTHVCEILNTHTTTHPHICIISPPHPPPPHTHTLWDVVVVGGGGTWGGGGAQRNSCDRKRKDKCEAELQQLSMRGLMLQRTTSAVTAESRYFTPRTCFYYRFSALSLTCSLLIRHQVLTFN